MQQQPLSTFKFVLKRLADDWKLLLSIFSGILIASTLVAGAPVYLNSLERLAINTAIDRASPVFLDMLVFAPNIPLEEEILNRTEGQIDEAIDRSIPEFYAGKERYLRGPVMLVGTEDQPLPVDSSGNDLVSRGYFQSLSNIEHHVTFEEGHMASDEVIQEGQEFRLDAIIGRISATVFALDAGDEIVLTPSLGDPKRMIVTITGIIEPTDPTEEYWQHNANLFISPAPLDEIPDVDIEVDPEEPPLALFVTREALIGGPGKAYPGTLLSSTWFILVEKEPLKEIRREDLSAKVATLESDIASVMQGSAVFTGIKPLISRFERRSFFSSVPLLLLLTIMVITVLYYIAMMVSYLVQSRENDVALLRSRGVSMMQLIRLYASEGLILTVLAAVLAPFVAMALIALSGNLPYFSELSHGEFLPVEFRIAPFFVSLVLGLISLIIFVVPSVVGARTSLIIHKLRSSRPPSTPLFQRYYLDILLLIIGGLVFWELNARGQIISGGLFSGIQINEALLFAPVLMLTLVALVFMRFFPLFVRFISGESPSLIHLWVLVSVSAMILTSAIEGLRSQAILSQALPVVLTLAIGLTYWLTDRAEQRKNWLYGLFAQAILVALVMVVKPPMADSITFLPSIAIMAIVPFQLLFVGFRGISRIAPVWLSMGMWHMARNPLQYSWLVLLLVMVTGLGVLATTVGGTLTRSYEERILYDVAADLRVTGVPSHVARGTFALKERYATIPGVTSVTLALRGRGSLGSNFTGSQIQVLGVDAHEFDQFAWYRDDFSERPLPILMNRLLPPSRTEPIRIPNGATELGVWVKPEAIYSNMFLWMVVRDSRGAIDTVTLGDLIDTDWHLVRTRVPSAMRPPLELVSIQIFEPVFGPAGTPGSIALDDIHAVVPGQDIVVLDDFEELRTAWLPLATSLISSDSVNSSRDDVFNGNRSAIFRFGKDTDRGIRGFYQSPNAGPVPIVASSGFIRSTGARLGQPLIIDLMGRFVPVAVQDTVEYFPTLTPRGAGFVIADLDSLLRHLNLLNPTSEVSPNEIYINEAPGAGEAVRDVVVRLVGEDFVRDRESQLEEVRLDPLITAGWRAMVLLALVVIIFTAGLGYVTYLLAFADRSRSEMGFLQSLGLSRAQMTGLLAMEHLIIVIVGLTLGSLTGWIMSDLMVSSVAVTEDGGRVVPPFILETNFRFLLPIYAALIGIFLVSLNRLIRSMRNVNLHAISRIEGV